MGENERNKETGRRKIIYIYIQVIHFPQALKPLARTQKPHIATGSLTVLLLWTLVSTNPQHFLSFIFFFHSLLFHLLNCNTPVILFLFFFFFLHYNPFFPKLSFTFALSPICTPRQLNKWNSRGKLMSTPN